MMRVFFSCLLATLIASPALAAPAAMTRDEIIALAKSGVGYSYWWGHGCWRTDGTQHGSCSGSCPSCTHTGSYGADCSGFAAKVWQVPSPSAVTSNAHPYSTSNFRWEQIHWDRINRDNTARGDCMVYRNDANTGGHIVVYESGDAWGSATVLECKGCAYGCVRNVKAMSTAYVTIRRHNLTTPVTTGKAMGSVFVDHGSGTDDMSERLPGAQVSVQGGPSATARDPDGFWSFELAPGTYTLTASAAGFESASRSCAVTAGGETWCSIGLTRACTPSCAGRECGGDGCGGSCGACPAHHACGGDGRCACQPDCAGLACGPDPYCATSCGSCGEGEACEAGACVCQPRCEGKACGDDGCGGACGACAQDERCTDAGQCEPLDACARACLGRACGVEPVCGLSCGRCPETELCDALGQCIALQPGEGKLYGYALEAEDGQALDPAARPRLPATALHVDTGLDLLADEAGYYEAAVPAGERSLSAWVTGHLEGRAECLALAGEAVECHVGLAVDPDVDPYDPDPDEPELKGGCATAAPGGASLAALALGLGLLLARRRAGR